MNAARAKNVCHLHSNMNINNNIKAFTCSVPFLFVCFFSAFGTKKNRCFVREFDWMCPPLCLFVCMCVFARAYTIQMIYVNEQIKQTTRSHLKQIHTKSDQKKRKTEKKKFRPSNEMGPRYVNANTLNYILLFLFHLIRIRLFI